MSTINITISGRLPRVRLPGFAHRLRRGVVLSRRAQLGLRFFAILTILILVMTITWPALEHHLAARHYDLTSTESALLPKNDKILAGYISRDATSGSYQFERKGPSGGQSGSVVGNDTTMLRANFPAIASKGISVTDPINKVNFTLTPKFALDSARQSGSHIYYPLSDGQGKLVYSPQASNVVEDLVLSASGGDRMQFDYSLGNNQNLEARLQHDGSVDVYGSMLASLGNISTGTDADAARLKNAEAKSEKTQLLFHLPAPIIKQSGGAKSAVKAHYALTDNGKTLRLIAENLKQATFPLDIDPTVSVNSLAQLYRNTNGESNVDFNSNGTISRGAITGGVINYTNGWTGSGNNLAAGHFLGSSVISNGYMYVGGGMSGTSTTNQSSLEYAQITSPTVGTWKSASLPSALSQYKLLSYNGYLYALGGSNGATVTNGGCTNPTANISYNPTQPNGALAASWTSTTALPAALCSFGAAIYNNTIYVIGGQTASGAANGTNKVYYASILPNGAIGAWTTTSPVTLPVSLYGADVQIYNGYIYVIGGYSNAASTVTLSTIYRAALNSDGSVYGTSSSNWASLPNTFATPNGSSGLANAGGGSFSTINDGYMYVSGGCKTVTSATQTCTSINSNTYIAQINADGTVGPWSTIASSNSVTEVGGSLLVFSNNLYLIAGCSAMNSASFTCNTSGNNLLTQSYATITDAGQIGPVTQLSPTLAAGLFDVGTVINNGYIYVIGGCSNNACTTTSAAIYYATISDSGTIGTWTTSARKINNTAGLAAMGAVVFDNYIYLTGGFTGGSGTVQTIWSAQITSNSNPELVADFASVGTGATNQLANSKSNTSTILDGTTGGNAYIFIFGGCTTGGTGYGCSTYYTTNYRYTVGPTGPVAGSGVSAVGTVPSLLNTHVTANNCATTVETTSPLACWTGVAAMATAFYGGYVYLAGGASNGGSNNVGQSSIVQYAKITNGTVGAWSTATNFLPAPIRRGAAYAMNGYLYIVGGHNALGNGGSGQTYQTVDIGKLNLSTGNLNDSAGITASSSQLQFSAWGGSVAFANGTVFEVGGCTSGNPPTSCGTRSANTQTFQPNNAGNAGTAVWAGSSNNYATNATGIAATSYGGYLYTAGGCTTYTFTALGNCTAVTNTTSYAKLNPDGSVGSWTAGPTLTAGSGYGCMVAVNGYLYYIGGVSATNVPTSAVYYSQIGANGVPGSWSPGTALTAARGHINCDTFAGTMYIVGGNSTSTSSTEGTNNTTVYYSQPNGSTISWSSGTAFTTARRDASVIAAGGYLYVIGGYSNGGTATYYNDVQYNSITPSTGALGSTWNFTAPLPLPLTQTTAIAANGYIFVFGGATGATTTTCQNSTYIASINNSGQLSTWTQGVDKFTTARFGAGSAYYNGYYYVLGGYGCAGSALVSTSPNIIQYGGEQSQSMNSFFTRYADLTGNSLPQKFVAFVTNAQLNSADIESWKMTYVSSSTANNGWGKATSLTPLTSGTVYNVYAYDGTGTDIKLAQWVSLAFSISMEKSFAFTDDTQPYVSSYYMYYSPYVKNRLRNGKIFQDQQQQGFDLNLH